MAVLTVDPSCLVKASNPLERPLRAARAVDRSLLKNASRGDVPSWGSLAGSDRD